MVKVKVQQKLNILSSYAHFQDNLIFFSSVGNIIIETYKNNRIKLKFEHVLKFKQSSN